MLAGVRRGGYACLWLIRLNACVICLNVQIDFFIHLWSSSPTAPNPHPLSSLSNKHRHFIDTGPDAAILFLTLSVMYWSPARLFFCTVWTFIDEYMHTHSHTHGHRGTYVRGLPFGQLLLPHCSGRRGCVHARVRVWATFKHWCLTTDSLLSYYYPSILHGGTTLLLHVFVHSWTARATTPSLIIAFHLSGDTETQGPWVNFSGTHHCCGFFQIYALLHCVQPCNFSVSLTWCSVSMVSFFF